MNYKHLLTAVGAALLLSASEAQATAILTEGNVPQLDENVLLNTGDIGMVIFGQTNMTGLDVRFTGNEVLTAPANGQARIEAQDGLFTYLKVDVPFGTFTSLILNLDADTDGTVDFLVTTNTGVQMFNDVAVDGNGNNFFTFTTIDNQRYLDIAVQADVPLSFMDAAQFRIGGAAVPDAASTFTLLGLGLASLATARRRFPRK